MSYLFESPWKLILGLFFTGVILIWAGFKSDRARVLLAGVCLFFLAIIIFISSIFVETEQERARKTLLSFINSIVENNTENAKKYLSEDSKLIVGSDKVDFAIKLDQLKRRIKLVSNSNRSIKMHIFDYGYEVDISCLTWPQGFRPVVTEWTFRLIEDQKGDFKITRVICHNFLGQPPRNTQLWARY